MPSLTTSISRPSPPYFSDLLVSSELSEEEEEPSGEAQGVGSTNEGRVRAPFLNWIPPSFVQESVLNRSGPRTNNLEIQVTSG